MKLNYLLFVFSVLFTFVSAKAQMNFDFTAGKFLLKGKISDVKTKEAIPNANIQLYGKSKGWSCDANGNFTIYVSKTDTLKISCVGYVSKIIMVADLDSATYYTLDFAMWEDVISIKTVKVYPFSRDGFNKYFVEFKDPNKITIAGVAPPKYSTKTPKATIANPISFLYEKIRKKPKVLTPELPPADPESVEH